MSMIGKVPHSCKHGFMSSFVTKYITCYMKRCPIKSFSTKYSSDHIGSPYYWLNGNQKGLWLQMSSAVQRNCGILNSSINCRKSYSKRVISPYKLSRDFSRDMVVYSYDNKRMFRYLTMFGVIQFVMWVNISSFLYEFFYAADKKNEEKQKEKSWWQRLMGLQTKYKYSSSIFCLMIASMVLFVTWIYPLRTVHKLTILTGGEKLRVTTYYHFGMTKDLNIPLNSISFSSTRQHRKDSTLSARVKGKWFYYMLDTRSGKFHNPELFDHVVGLERKL